MTVCEQYALDNNFEPLKPKEIKKGKTKLKIYGTDIPMPWIDVYTRIRGGMSLDDISKMYGHIRKITLFAILDDVDFDPSTSDTIDDIITTGRKINAIDAVNPNAARTMKEMANEYAPDLGMKVAQLSISVVDRAQKIVNDNDCTSNDLKNITTAIQSMTDTVELTDRHSKVGGNNITAIQVEGFSFVRDEPPVDVDAIELKESDG